MGHAASRLDPYRTARRMGTSPLQLSPDRGKNRSPLAICVCRHIDREAALVDGDRVLHCQKNNQYSLSLYSIRSCDPFCENVGRIHVQSDGPISVFYIGGLSNGNLTHSELISWELSFQSH